MTVSTLPDVTVAEDARAAQTLRLLARSIRADPNDPHGREARPTLDRVAGQYHDSLAHGDRAGPAGIGDRH